MTTNMTTIAAISKVDDIPPPSPVAVVIVWVVVVVWSGVLVVVVVIVPTSMFLTRSVTYDISSLNAAKYRR